MTDPGHRQRVVDSIKGSVDWFAHTAPGQDSQASIKILISADSAKELASFVVNALIRDGLLGTVSEQQTKTAKESVETYLIQRAGIATVAGHTQTSRADVCDEIMQALEILSSPQPQ